MSADCPLCSAAGQDILWQDDFCRVVLVGDPDYPGFCRVILNAHVKEMTDLAPTDRQRTMIAVLKVEDALREVLNPDKINLASLGNLVPHLHWHVIPRFAGDRHFPDAVWAAPRNPAATTETVADLRPRLIRALTARLGPSPE
ncbi:MAG: HIT family protein [Gallionellaceae bacterium]|nr:HIT family protein [Gallionellaceae bacterium]MDD5366982.1 HIT family protein [Gallionellaceae bacterium]